MPITPVFEQPPVNPRGPGGLDWTEVIDALAEHPGEWARVDGPYSGTGVASGRVKSIVKFAERAECTVEAKTAKREGEQWLYARLVPAKAAPKARLNETTPKPVADAPDPAPSVPRTEFGGTHDCDTCGATFRTNIRLRQHQANAHKAS